MTTTLHLPRTIARKRDGEPLDDAEITAVINGYSRGEIPDYQLAALAMAVFFRGMNPQETATLTRAMWKSGATLAWNAGGLPKVDKHSTGGVGDKVSIVLAPLLAACGLAVPMISGRGLGHTGGTLDKMGAISGMRTDLSADEIRAVVEDVGCVIVGQTADLVPADKKLYALRDVTGTVESVPLITASILSKKLAENLDALVMDIKCGVAAFMKTRQAAQTLAESIVSVAGRLGLKCTALITNMDRPLGHMSGHAVEIQESIDTLQNRGPEDLRTLTVALGAELLVAVGRSANREQATEVLEEKLRDGSGWRKFQEMVKAQGGRLEAGLRIARPEVLEAVADGYVASINALKVADALIALGGSRQRIEDTIDLAVGVELLVEPGAQVRRGQPVARIFVNERGVAEARKCVEQAIKISDHSPPAAPLIIDRITP